MQPRARDHSCKPDATHRGRRARSSLRSLCKRVRITGDLIDAASPRRQRSRPIPLCGSESLIVPSKSTHTGCQQENAMARVVRFHETGGPEVLKIEQLDDPPPEKGEVQIRVKALGLNRAESMFRRGEYIEQPDFPARIGYEAAGTVAAVDPGGDRFKVGDAVNPLEKI